MGMQFDRTYLTVRQRTVLEALDLALLVIRDHFPRLLLALLIGMGPWLAIDVVLLARWQGSEQDGWIFILMLVLITAQAPLGTAILTHFLGKVMFMSPRSLAVSLRVTLQNLRRLMWVHGVVRLGFPLMVLVILMGPNWHNEAQYFYAFFVIGVALFVVLLIRALRPFTNEIILLERPSRGAASGSGITYAARSAALHNPSSGQLFGNAIVVSGFACLLFITIQALFSMRGYVFGSHNDDFLFYSLTMPLSAWLVAGFITVARFLAYLDVRIRQEGWEVELRMRAEAKRYEEG